MNRPRLVYLMENPATVSDSPKAHESSDPLTVESIDNHIYFYSEVNTDRTLALMQKLREIDSELRTERNSRNLPDDYPLTPIWLHIQSDGGEAFPSLSVSDQIKQISSPVFSIIEGVCSSGATLISLSCKRRFIQPSGFMLIHQLSSMSWGTYSQLKDDMRLWDMLMAKIVDFYVKNTKMQKDEVQELLKHDSWFDADGCVEKGLADEVMG